ADDENWVTTYPPPAAVGTSTPLRNSSIGLTHWTLRARSSATVAGPRLTYACWASAAMAEPSVRLSADRCRGRTPPGSNDDAATVLIALPLAPLTRERFVPSTTRMSLPHPQTSAPVPVRVWKIQPVPVPTSGVATIPLLRTATTRPAGVTSTVRPA